MTTEPHGRSPVGAPRTLAEALRAQPDGTLAELLHARPDLLTPVPQDLTQLATRAATRVSVLRALERLDRRALQTAEALAVAPDPCTYRVLAGLLPDLSGAGVLPRALTTLRRRALVWGDDQRLRLVRTALEVLTPSPEQPSATGLGPTLAEATSGMSPGRLQRILSTLDLPATPDPVTAVAALGELFADDKRMSALLAEAPPGATEVLSKLLWGPPYGSVNSTRNAASTVSGGTGGGELSPPVSWLLDRGLLLPAGRHTVVLPREAALQLRGGRAHRAAEPSPPVVQARVGHSPQSVDGAAAGQAFAALSTVEELLGFWEMAGPPVLRSGGLGVRELKRTAVALDLTEPVTAFWIELAYSAGLLAPDGQAAERYAPTPDYDSWLRRPVEQRWSTLVAAWLSATRVPGLAGGRDAKGRQLVVLGPGLDQPVVPEIRRRALELLAGLEPGGTAELPALLARLTWERPLRLPAELRAQLAGWALDEAELLGVTGRGAVPSFARTLFATDDQFGADFELGFTGGLARGLADGFSGTGDEGSSSGAEGSGAEGSGSSFGDMGSGAEGSGSGDMRSGTEAGATPTAAPLIRSALDTTVPSAAEVTLAAETAAALLAPLLPRPLDHILLQADLTAVAPGPLERPLAALLNVLAEVESKGGATVYRFTPESVRRALDTGRSANDLHVFLQEHSTTPVPQPLSYLIDDVARRHGRLRVGAAAGYLRCDDEALLAEIVADRRTEGLGLRRLAPTVLATRSAPDTVLSQLRELGYAPAAESHEGDVLVIRAEANRTPWRRPPEPVRDGPPVPDLRLLAPAVRAIRAGDSAAATDTPRNNADSEQRGEGAESGQLGDGHPSDLPRTATADILAAIQCAALTSSTVCIGYVSAAGTATRRLIAPVRVEGGFVTGYDHTANDVRTYPLHRITGVTEPAEDGTG